MQTILHIFLGLLYILLSVAFFKWINQRKENPIAAKWLILAFVAKVMAGLAYGYIYEHYYSVSDSWAYFRESLLDYQYILHDPAAFFATNGKLNQLTDFFSTADNAFWNNAGENILIKLLGILNIFSGGNYYVDSILFNCFSFWGLYLIYLTAIHYFHRNKILLFVTIFLLPSSLFWNSGIDKDGLMLFFSGILIYSVHRCLLPKKSAWQIVAVTVGFCGILLMRNVNALVFIPAIIAWYYAAKLRHRVYAPFLIVYIACTALFFLSALSTINLPLKLAQKQQQFLSLEANTRLPLTPLEPNAGSYVQVLPQAFNHVFLRPYPNEIKSPFHLMALAENVLVLIIIVLAIQSSPYGIKRIFTIPFSLFLLFVAVTGLLLIGYTVPFTGAIIRYKAMYMVLFLLPFIDAINIKKTYTAGKPV